jgi:hypothetical protein
VVRVAQALLQTVGTAGVLVMCFGYSESPIDATPQVDLEAKLLGTWRCLPPDARPDIDPWIFAVSQARDRVYGIRAESKDQAPRLLEAYPSLINGRPLLNVNVHELDQQTACLAPWTFVRYAFLSPDVLRIRYVKADALRGVEQTPSALRRVVERIDGDTASYAEGPLCVRTGPTSAASPAPPAPPPATPQASPSPQAATDSPRIVARFAGTITGLSLPREPVKVIPIGVDPQFVLSIKISRMIEGTLPSPGQSVAFLIHSPTRFFVDNLPSTPVREGTYPPGEFVFSLVATRGPTGAVEFGLRMALPPPRGNGTVK